METSTNIRVAVRCRPLNRLEKELECACIINIDGPGITVTDPNKYNAVREHPFAFDHCYFTQATQEQIYADLGVPILEKALAGYNGTIFAYGQTGSGKTHSITGTPDDPGIIPRMNKDLFDHIAKTSTPTHPFLVLISYLELYNENIHDLMNPDGKPLKIREHPKMGVYVENLAELVVSNAAEIEQKMIEGNNVRHVAATKMNERSSRSHSVFTIRIEQKDTTSDEGTSLAAKINLVDLAGSERAGKTEAEGSTLKEASMINGSLSALGNVINALADPKKRKGHIPFRSSKLTRLLQESLGGNTVTSMIAAVSPADRNFDESLNTLQYANRAKNIQNASKKNETNLAKVIKDLRAQIEELTMQLERGEGKGRGTTDIQRVLAELEFVKQQNWEEKRKLSQKFESNRWVSIAKNGMLQFKANLLRQQTFQAQEEIEMLKDERTQLMAQLEGLDGRVGSLESEVKQLNDDEQRVMQSQFTARTKITDVLTRRIVTKWRTQVLLRRNSKNLAEYKHGVSSNSNSDLGLTFQEKLHQQHSVILNLKEESEKAESLEAKMSYQTQEMELLQEESAQIKQENEMLEEKIEEKSKEMEALCEEVAAMLGSENEKIEDLNIKAREIEEEIKMTREATNTMQEELLQELSRQEEAESKVASVAQENARLDEIRKLELEASKSRVNQLARTGSFGMPRMGSMGSIYTQHVVTPVASDEELIQGIERSLSGTNLGSISNSVRDGVFLCKLINKAAPGTIDERVLNVTAKFGTQEAHINLCLDSARALGCNLSSVSTEAIMRGEEGSITSLIAEVVRMGQLSQVSVQKHTNLLNLRDKSEEISSFFKLSPEAILIRWFNHHLAAARHPRSVANFGKDIKDSENYAVLLNRLACEDLCDLTALRKEPDLLARAHCVLEAAGTLGCKKYVSPRDIIEAHEERNSLFVAYLFEKFPDVEPPPTSSTTSSSSPSSPSASPRLSSSPSSSKLRGSSSLTRSGRTQKEVLMQLIEENQGEKREERAMRVWINGLGLPVYVRNLTTELTDGILILQILDKVYNGVVNWKKVNKAPNSIYKKIENCNYCVELGKQLKFSLVGIAGKDICDGNMKLSLALLSQVMQYYFLNMLKTLRFGGKEVKEEDIIKWMNDKVAALPRAPTQATQRARITGFKDPALSTGLVFIDLLHALRPGCVAQELVQRGETREQSLANAKYIISVARKIGASTFLVPEDIVELNGKMILAFVGSLMSL